MIRDTLRYIEEQHDQTAKGTCQAILSHLRGVIMVSNEREFDELLLCGLFALKVFRDPNYFSTSANDSTTYTRVANSFDLKN